MFRHCLYLPLLFLCQQHIFMRTKDNLFWPTFVFVFLRRGEMHQIFVTLIEAMSFCFQPTVRCQTVNQPHKACFIILFFSLSSEELGSSKDWQTN